MPQEVLAVIPARYQSTRLEAKLLQELAGKTVLQRTYEQVCKAKHITKVLIACDDERILEHCKAIGAEAELTSKDHQSGTDRIAEIAKRHPQWQIIINIQGDEPFINPSDIDKAIEPFLHDPLLEMSSLFHLIYSDAEIQNPNNVKVVTDENSDALYFSRAAIPFVRDAIRDRHVADTPRDDKSLQGDAVSLRGEAEAIPYKKHIGLYAYRRETLLQIASLEATELEKLEKLEQLRAISNGIKIKMLEVESAPIGIDTAEDLESAKKLLSKNSATELHQSR